MWPNSRRSESGWLGPQLLQTCCSPGAARAGGSGSPVYCTARSDRPLFRQTACGGKMAGRAMGSCPALGQIKRRCARQSRAHHRTRFQGSESYSPAWYDRARAAQHEGSWFVDRSGSPLCGAACGCRIHDDRGRSMTPKSLRSAHIGGWRLAAPCGPGWGC